MSRFVVGNIFIGSLIGALLAISIPLFFVIVSVFWLSVFIQLARTQPIGQRWRTGLAMLIMQGGALAVIITGAVLAPVKTHDRLLDLPVALPKTEMSLAELKELTETHQFQVPALRSIDFPELEALKIVRWPAQGLTLREFVAAIEEQTRLRHRFRSCGNSLTILWGNDCVFGMDLGVPDERLACDANYP
jgi:hypothetical protein